MTDMNTRSKRLSFAALLVGGSLFIGACGGEPAGQQTDETPSSAVLFETAGAAAGGQTTTYSGSVEGARRVALSTRVMGRVVQLNVDEGDEVSAGDVLLRIDDGQLTAQRRQAEAGLREARANLENARTNFARFDTLLAQESATQREFDDAKTMLESAEARARSLESRIAEVDDALQYTVIRSPVSGVVAERSIDQGAMAAPGAPLLVVETVDALKVIATVPESDVNRLSAGQAVRIHVDAAGVSLPGVIEEVNRSASGPGRRYTMRVVFGDDTAGIRPGMFARVSAASAAASGEAGAAITVPEDALIRKGQLTGLYALTADDRVILRWVRTGLSSDGRVEILSGLAAGERYVIPGGERLEDGQLVTAVLADDNSQTTQ